MEDLHAAIAAHLRRQRPTTPLATMRDVAIYARVAAITPTASLRLDTQVDACQAFARKHGDRVALTYREVADGLSLDRARLAELRAAIAHGWVQSVLVTTTDRLTRDPLLLAALCAEWAATGVALVVVMEEQ